MVSTETEITAKQLGRMRPRLKVRVTLAEETARVQRNANHPSYFMSSTTIFLENLLSPAADMENGFTHRPCHLSPSSGKRLTNSDG